MSPSFGPIASYPIAAPEESASVEVLADPWFIDVVGSYIPIIDMQGDIE